MAKTLYINNIVIIIIIAALCIIVYSAINENDEYLTSVSTATLSNESVQNMGSVLNTGSGTVNNLTITGSLKIGNTTIGSDGSITLKGTNSTYTIKTENDTFIIRNLTPPAGTTDVRYAFGNDGFIDFGKDIAARNIKASSDVTAGGNMNVGSNITLGAANKWLIQADNNDKFKRLNIKPWGKSDWLWAGGISSAQGTLFDGKKAKDGSDVISSLSIPSGDGNDCAAKCSAIPGVTRALYKKNDKLCWCKNNDVNTWQSDDNNYATYNFA